MELDFTFKDYEVTHKLSHFGEVGKVVIAETK